jgi:hypothetical protein
MRGRLRPRASYPHRCDPSPASIDRGGRNTSDPWPAPPRERGTLSELGQAIAPRSTRQPRPPILRMSASTTLQRHRQHYPTTVSQYATDAKRLTRVGLSTCLDRHHDLRLHVTVPCRRLRTKDAIACRGGTLEWSVLVALLSPPQPEPTFRH